MQDRQNQINKEYEYYDEEYKSQLMKHGSESLLTLPPALGILDTFILSDEESRMRTKEHIMDLVIHIEQIIRKDAYFRDNTFLISRKIGHAYFILEEWKNCRDWFQKAIQSYNSNDIAIQEGLLLCHTSIGVAELRMQNFAASLKSLEAALLLATSQSNENQAYHIQLHQAQCYGELGENTKKIDLLQALSQEYLNKAQNEKTWSNKLERLYEISLQLGLSYADFNQIDQIDLAQSTFYFQKAKDLLETKCPFPVAREEGLEFVTDKIGRNLLLQNRKREAVPYFEAILKARIELCGENSFNVAQAYNMLGEANVTPEDVVAGKQEFCKALEILKIITDQYDSEDVDEGLTILVQQELAKVHLNLAETCARSNDFKGALENSRQGFQIRARVLGYIDHSTEEARKLMLTIEQQMSQHC